MLSPRHKRKNVITNFQQYGCLSKLYSNTSCHTNTDRWNSTMAHPHVHTYRWAMAVESGKSFHIFYPVPRDQSWTHLHKSSVCVCVCMEDGLRVVENKIQCSCIKVWINKPIFNNIKIFKMFHVRKNYLICNIFYISS